MNVAKTRKPVSIPAVFQTIGLSLAGILLIDLTLFLIGWGPIWFNQFKEGSIPGSFWLIIVLSIALHLILSTMLYSVTIRGSQEELEQVSKDITIILEVCGYLKKGDQPRVFTRNTGWRMGFYWLRLPPDQVEMGQYSNRIKIEGVEEIVDKIYGQFKWRI